MLDYAIGIVAHQRREEHAHNLAATVDAVHIGWDDDTTQLGAYINHCNVWERLAKHHTQWSVILEDDAIPTDGFQDQLHSALMASPTPIVSLYLGRQFPIWAQDKIPPAIEKLQANNACYIIAPYLLHCVGVAIKTEHIPSLLTTHYQALPIDEHITRWAQWRFEQPAVAYTWPSLVNHNDALPSVIGTHNDAIPRTPGRTAWHTGGRQQWTSDNVEMRP